MNPPIALGFRDHTGWTIAIAATIRGASITILHRDRLTLLEAGLPAQVYHAARELPVDAAQHLLEEVTASARQCAQQEVEQLVSILDIEGHRPATAAIPLSPPVPPNLLAILGSHTALHAAEGALYRDALDDACSSLAIHVTRYNPRDATSVAASLHGFTAADLEARLTALRTTLGSPWQADHKLATAAALLTLR